MTKGVLANILGASQETLSRVLGKLGQEGVIEVQGKEITILDRTKSRGWSWPAGVAGTRMSPGPAPVAALPAATWWVSLWVSTPATTQGPSPGSVPGARPGGVCHHDDAPSSWWARRSGPSGSGR